MDPSGGQRCNIPPARARLLRRLEERLRERSQVGLKGEEGLNDRLEGPFSIFNVAISGSERIDVSPLTLDAPAGLGDTAFDRRKVVE
jgi:hypothetical protein